MLIERVIDATLVDREGIEHEMPYELKYARPSTRMLNEEQIRTRVTHNTAWLPYIIDHIQFYYAEYAG